MNKELIIKLCDASFSEMVKLRRSIHQLPELAFCETETSNTICMELDKLGIPYQKQIAKTGIVASIHGNFPGKTVALRADMDALSIQEETPLPYSSKKEGIMHACGHDAHVAMLLGTAQVLNQLKNYIHGTVQLIFQPAEEDTGGALPMIEQGILENPKVDVCIAAHISPCYPTGCIGLKKGVLTASPDLFTLTVNGKGGHGALPQEAADPIIAASMMLSAFQTIISRNLDPLKSAVITAGTFHAGSNANTIANHAEICGTIRTFDQFTRNFIPKRMQEIAASISKAMGTDYNLSFEYLYPPLYNDDSVVNKLSLAVEEIIGKDNIVWEHTPSMIGEDFAYFSEKVPSAMFYVGSRNEKTGAVFPLHSPKFLLDEPAMLFGEKTFVQFVLDYLS